MGRTFCLWLLVALSVSAPLFAHADTVADLNYQLQQLILQYNALRQQVASSPTPPPSSPQCAPFYRTLRLGMSGSDVASMQHILIARGFLDPSSATGFFGPLTQRAVQALQQQYGLASGGTPDTTGFGLVGARTRGLLQSLCQSPTSSGPVAPPPPVISLPISSGMCVVAGSAIPSGASATLYSTQSVPSGNCESYSQVRRCANGFLSGNPEYQFTSCIATSCSQDGITMAQGENRTFYRQKTLPYGFSCQGISRACVNGVLSDTDDYPFASCTSPLTPASCTLDDVTIEHGKSRTFYKQPTVLPGQTCTPFAGTRMCSNGRLEGESVYAFSTCSVSEYASCKVVVAGATTTVAHGASKNFWSRESVPYTLSCDTYRLTRACNDGILSGSSSHAYPECEVIPAKSCSLSGIVVAHGASRNFYSKASVSSGDSCSKYDVARKCTNGVLSGSTTYKYPYCSPVGSRYCSLDGVYVAHDKSRTFFSQEIAPFGSACDQFDLSRICKDGTLSGSSSYSRASCTGAIGRSCELDEKTVEHNTSSLFYSARSAADCTEYAQTRKCVDGDLSGNEEFKYRACAHGTAYLTLDAQVASAISSLEALLLKLLEQLAAY